MALSLSSCVKPQPIVALERKMKVFSWIRIVLAVLGLVAKKTKTKKDDEVIEAASGVSEIIEDEIKESQKPTS